MKPRIALAMAEKQQPSQDPGDPSPGTQNSALPTPDSQTDMPPGGSRRPHTPRREADLSSLLSSGEKAELLLLISKITEKMQRQIIQVFESSGVGDPKKQAPPNFWNKLPAKLRDLSLQHADKENQKPGSSKQGQGNEKESGAKEPLEDEETEVVGLQELKKEILHFFRRWQASVQRRTADISVSAKGPPNAAQRGQQSSSMGKRRGSAKVKPKPSSAPTQNHSPKLPEITCADNYPDTRSTEVEADAALIHLHPPTPTGLTSLPMEKRILLLHSMLLLLLSLENYSAYSRVLLLNIASSLHIPLHILAEDEVRVAKSLSQVTKEISGDEEIQKRNEENKTARRWKVGLASVAGAAVIGITGGLAAPLVAAGIGTVLGGIGLGSTAAASLLGAMAESSLVVGTLFGIYGAKASAKMVDQYTKDIQDFAFLPLHGAIRSEYRDGKDVAPDDRRLRVVLGIGGWLVQKEDVVNPWRSLGHQSEVYALRWELEALMKMGNSLETVVKSAAWSLAKKEIIARTSKRALPPR